MTTKQIQSIETVDIQALTTKQIQAIETVDIQALTTKQIQAIEIEDIRAFTLPQCQALTSEQRLALTSEQLLFACRKKLPITNIYNAGILRVANYIGAPIGIQAPNNGATNTGTEIIYGTPHPS